MAMFRAMLLAGGLCLAAHAHASFHFMQIEQVIGGVHGDVSQQAVQLRMRAAGQNQLQFSRLLAYDANGDNPVLLMDFDAAVPSGNAGDRVLVTTLDFASRQNVAVDFMGAAVIPAAYFGGGRLSFESDGGQVVYSLCWGNYAGPNDGSTDNDDDGQFGPCEPGPLPSAGTAALRFSGAATDLGTSNAADFALSTAPAVFTNNNGSASAVVVRTFALRGGDCDDNDPSISPAAAEVPDNLRDDDCDGLADEDAFGAPSANGDDGDADGFPIAAGDCDGTRQSTWPGAPEVVGDLRDNDCDRLTDESVDDVPTPDGIDHDNDDYGPFARVFGHGFE